MRTLRFLLIPAVFPLLLSAGQETGVVRAADQFIPGATVTASQGTAKVVAYTDENGRYSMNLPPGVWELKVEMLGFTPATKQVTVSNEPGFRNWTLDMPRAGDQSKPSATAGAPPTNQNAGGRGRGGRGRGFGGQANDSTQANSGQGQSAQGQTGQAAPGRGSAGPGRGGFGPGRGGPGFQNAQANATQQQQQDQGQALADAAAGLGGLDVNGGDADQAFLVTGSTSGGLATASDDEARRQQNFNGRGGPGGRGGPDALASLLGTPPGMGGPAGDTLGLGGFGAAAIDGGFNGFDGGPGGGGGFGGPGGGPGGPGGGFGGGGGRGGGGRGGGGGGRGGAGRGNGRAGRGPFNGDFSSFGNRRRQQPAYTGSVFINLANSALNAAPFSLNGQAVPKPSSSREQFGVNIGGPLVIPKILNWKRANFYFTYQGTISRNPFNQAASLPTEAERNGDFSQSPTGKPITIYDPLSGLPFPNNVIPATRINPAALGLLQYFPSPTSSGLIQNYNLVGSTPNNNNNIGTRFNMPLNRKDRLNFNVQFQDRNSQTLQLFGYRDSSSGTGLSAQAGWNHSFAPRFNNSASVTLSRNNNTYSPYFAYTANVASELGIQGTSQEPINYGPPNLSFTNFGGLSDGSASVTRNQTMTFTDTLTFVYKQKHNLSFGYTYNRLQQNSLTYQNARGAYSFSGLVTSEIGPNGQPVAGTGYDFADFLLGFPQSASLRYGSDNNYFRSWSTSAFAQDDFRVSRNLSINVGLRYEYFAPYTELYGHLANIVVNPSFTDAAVVTPGVASPYSGSLPSSLVRSDPNLFSPRVGFAWRPFQKVNTLFRGGYSIFYSGSSYAQIASQMASQPPFATTGSFSTSLAAPLTIEDGFVAAPPTIGGTTTITNTYAVDPNYKLAYAQQWVFAIQNSLPHGFLIETEYLGTKGTHLGVYEQPNQAVQGTSVVTAQQQLRIPYATGFNYQTDGANSSFNAAQLRVTRRFQRGMSFVALYTYSKSIDNASSFTGTGGTLVQFVNDWWLERGLSTTDQRQRLNLTYTLSSPVGVNGMMRNGGWKTHLLAGWTLNGTFTAQSGTPLTAKVAGNLSNTGGIGALGTIRAEATGLPISGSSNPYYNLQAFTTPPAGEYGNAGRDTIPGPFQTSLNASLNRAFRFGESRRQLQLRLSANNVFNHVIITSFGTTVNSATYGLPTAASATRAVNLLLRFNF